MNTKQRYIIISTAIIVIIFLGYKNRSYFLPFPIVPAENIERNDGVKERCITTDHLAIRIPKELVGGKEIGLPLYPITVEVNSSTYSNKFVIENVSTNVHAIHISNCAVYVLKEFSLGSDVHKNKYELWRYSYEGAGSNILTFYDGDEKKGFAYSLLSQVDFQEKYLALLKGFVGDTTYQVVIKDLDTLEDRYVIDLKNDLFTKYPQVVGDVEFKGWTKDERYFWFSLFDQAYVLAWVRVDMADGSYEVYKAPVGAMNGDAINIETGWVTYDDGPPWSGFTDFDEQFQKEWESEGKKVSFALYNLFTKQNILLETIADTTWFYMPKWIDDKTLEYVLPDETKKLYTLPS